MSVRGQKEYKIHNGKKIEVVLFCILYFVGGDMRKLIKEKFMSGQAFQEEAILQVKYFVNMSLLHSYTVFYRILFIIFTVDWTTGRSFVSSA